MPSHAHFGFLSAEGAELGASSDAISEAQEFLRKFGYLRRELVGKFSLGTFDDSTQSAIRLYQDFHGLPITGELDAATLAEMSKPRCGFPDFPDIGEYELDGRKWTKRNLTYRFRNFTPDMSQDKQKSAIQQAFELWDRACGLSFSETSGSADIEISFATGDHGDGSSFDGPGRVLAHAFFPPPNGGNLAGDAHFDESEVWETNLPIPSARIDLVTVAAHEFGHSIGLRHSKVRGALMFPTYGGPMRYLHSDDQAGARAIYGS